MNWRSAGAVIFEDETLQRAPLKALSLSFLVLALLCAWVPHREDYLLFWQSSVSFMPDFISGTLALAIVAPLYARRILPYPHHSASGILFLLANLALTATFIQIALGKGSTLGTLPALTVIVCAVALSWLGIRAAASVAWLALLALSVVSVVFGSDGWGIAGFGFVVSGFCGLLLQTSLSPSGLLAEITKEYARPGLPSQDTVAMEVRCPALLSRRETMVG